MERKGQTAQSYKQTRRTVTEYIRQSAKALKTILRFLQKDWRCRRVGTLQTLDNLGNNEKNRNTSDRKMGGEPVGCKIYTVK